MQLTIITLFSIILLSFLYLKRNELLFPLVGTSFGYVLYFILPYYAYNDGYYINNIPIIVVYFFILTFIAYALGVFSVEIFFKSGKSRKEFKTIIIPKYKHILIFGIALIFIKILHLLSGYKTNAINSIGKTSALDIFIVYLDIVTIFYMILLSYSFFYYSKKQYKKLLIVISIILVFLDLSYGSKSRIIFEVLPFLFWYNWYYKRIPWKTLGILFLFTLLLFPFSLALKLNKNLAGNMGLIEMLKLRAQIIKNSHISILDMFIGRVNLIEPLKKIFENQDKISIFLSYYPGHSTIFPLFFEAFIPRFILTRIDSNPGGYFGYIFGWTTSPHQAYVSSSLIGELYMNFGFIGAMLSMFFLGMLHQFFYIISFKTSKRFISKFLYMYFYLYVILSGLESYFVIRYNIFVKNAFLMLFLWIFLNSFFVKLRYIRELKKDKNEYSNGNANFFA